MWKTVGFICYLIILSIYDIRTRQIPVVWLAIGGMAAFVNMMYLCLCQPSLEIVVEIWKSCLPGIVMLIAARFSGKIGGGDGCVLLVAGSILGSVKIMAVFAGSLMLVAVTAAILLVFRKVSKNDKLPFVPFLAISAILPEVL